LWIELGNTYVYLEELDSITYRYQLDQWKGAAHYEILFSKVFCQPYDPDPVV
jgi:hypothetical protein